MNVAKCIAIDAMGGDGGVEMTLPACVEALRQDPDLGLMLIGNERCMQDGLKHVPEALLARISIIHTKDAVFDDDKPAQVLRKGRQSSMFKAIELVKNGKAQAMVSAGNTGALLLTGRHLLKTLPGIRKPAIVATLPGTSRQTFLLDVGANPECDGPQLFEFAVMGMVLAEALERQPVSVGLLNIGAELHKGTAAVQEAAALMMDSPALDYAGFIEANELFEGAADVVVCDGFVGNVIIKSSAGVANVV
ncbi:MAG: phosphate acyltransferase, partial [Gammaproteobacteria bacterium]|nr:phosphate acyltransferase [Gammaproteobacteria bacterium]